MRSRVFSLGRTASRPRATSSAVLRLAASPSRTPIWLGRWIIGTRFARRIAPSRSSPATSEGLEPEVDMRTRLLLLLPLLAGLPPHPATLPGNVVDIVAGDFYFRAPDTIPAGLTTLRLRVLQGGHIAVLLRLDSGYTASDLLRARREGHNRPALVALQRRPRLPAARRARQHPAGARARAIPAHVRRGGRARRPPLREGHVPSARRPRGGGGRRRRAAARGRRGERARLRIRFLRAAAGGPARAARRERRRRHA